VINTPRRVPACVARPVGKAKLRREPLALKAIKAEWGRLRAKRVWDIASVREWNNVAAEARREGKEIHVGRLFGICVEKGSELPNGDEEEIHIPSCISGGSRCKSELRDCARPEFGNLTCRETLLGLLYQKKHGQANGRVNGAALLLSSRRLSTATLIVVHFGKSIVTGRCAWKVASLSRTGHRVISTNVSNCSSWFTWATKLSVPEVNFKAGWELISKRINIEKPSKAGPYLGCRRAERTVEFKDGQNVIVGSYNVESYLANCVLRYCDLVKEHTGKDVQMKRADIPFLPEDQATSSTPPFVSTDLTKPAPFVSIPILNRIFCL
jgi:hypothetical protein